MVAQTGDFLVKTGAPVEKTGGEGGVLPACTPIGGLEKPVEGCSHQQGVRVPGGEGYRGQVGGRAQGFADRDLLPAAAVIL